MFWSRKKKTLSTRKYRDYFACLDHNSNRVLDLGDFLDRARRLCALRQLEPGCDLARELEDAERAFWYQMQSSMDEDGDGVISLDEFIGFHRSLARDVARSGSVPAWAMAPVRALLSVVDSNNDGLIQPDEYATYLEATTGSRGNAAAAFARLDLNQDGFIDLTELEQHYMEWLTSEDPDAPGNLLVTGHLPPPPR